MANLSQNIIEQQRHCTRMLVVSLLRIALLFVSLPSSQCLCYFPPSNLTPSATQAANELKLCHCYVAIVRLLLSLVVASVTSVIGADCISTLCRLVLESSFCCDFL